MNVTTSLKAAGFDLTHKDRKTGYYKVQCGACEAMTINGTPTHEIGCPNAKKRARR